MLRVEDLSVSYGSVRALEGVNLEVAEAACCTASSARTVPGRAR